MDQVTLSKDATDACVAACDTFLAGVDSFLFSGLQVMNQGAFGTLESGKALAGKFVGVTIGEHYSMDAILRQHVEVIKKLRAAFITAGERYIETDAQNSANLTAQQPR